jgi:hypothetical protein
MKEPKFESEPRYVGLDLAKRTMEVCVLRDRQKPRRFAGTGTGEAGRDNWRCSLLIVHGCATILV